MLNSIHSITGKYKDAERIYKLCLDSRKEILGEDHSGTLYTVTLLASSLSSQLKYEEAEQLYKDNLEKQKRLLGEDHIQTLTTATSLATCYANQGNVTQTRIYYLTLFNIITITGKKVEATQLFKQCYEQEKNTLGENHPNTLDNMKNVGTAHLLLNLHLLNLLIISNRQYSS